MGTRIDAVAVVTGNRWRRRSAKKLADAAAETCLKRARLAPGELDLLVNAGIYHDRCLGEPALAAIIQEDIGANPEDPHEGGRATFSFDVANGSCGMLTGLQIADGFLAAGTIEHALVVASDAPPGRGLAPPHFPFAAAGGAIACSWVDGPAGLGGFRFGNRPVDGGGLGAAIGYERHPGRARDRGANRLRIDEHPGFAEQAASWAAEVATCRLADDGLAVADVDLVVANPLTAAFRDALTAHLGVDPARVVAADDQARVHTAGLAVALHAAERHERWRDATTILLVSAGAGLTAGAALVHRVPPDPGSG